MKHLIRPDVDPFVESLLEKCNPFGMSFADGRSMFFSQQSEAYLYVMLQAWRLAPRGYIEVPLLLKKLYRHIPFKSAVFLTMGMKPLGIKPVELIENWSHKEAKAFFERFLAGLCNIASTSYSTAYVDYAWQLFQQRLEIEALAKEKNEP